jgi:hypothetical protein
MSDFSTHMRFHALVCDARCVLCGAVYQQLYVGAVLFEDDQAVGPVCPRCLSHPPARCAREARERAAQLWDQAGEAAWDGALAQEKSARAREQVMADHAGREQGELRRAEGRLAREAARREGMAWPGPARPTAEPATVQEKEDGADLLDSLAEGVGLLPAWPTSLGALQDAERVAFQATFPTLPAEEVRRFVEARYDEFLPPHGVGPGAPELTRSGAGTA